MRRARRRFRETVRRLCLMPWLLLAMPACGPPCGPQGATRCTTRGTIEACWPDGNWRDYQDCGAIGAGWMCCPARGPRTGAAGLACLPSDVCK